MGRFLKGAKKKDGDFRNLRPFVLYGCCLAIFVAVFVVLVGGIAFAVKFHLSKLVTARTELICNFRTGSTVLENLGEHNGLINHVSSLALFVISYGNGIILAFLKKNGAKHGKSLMEALKHVKIALV